MNTTIDTPTQRTQCIRYDTWRDGWHGGWCVTHDSRWSTDFGQCDTNLAWEAEARAFAQEREAAEKGDTNDAD